MFNFCTIMLFGEDVEVNPVDYKLLSVQELDKLSARIVEMFGDESI